MKNQKTKNNKGITLIALIITIIVLLILAVVAISAVKDDGIINYAQNARDEYGKAGVNENTTLKNYLDKIKENLPTSTTSTGEDGEEEGIIFSIDGKEYKIATIMDWEQWCEGREDYYISEDNGMVMCRGSENKGVYCINCDAQKHGGLPVNFCPGCGSSDSWTHAPVETITFTYEGASYYGTLTAPKGATWKSWKELDFYVDNEGYVYFAETDNWVCYEDGSRVRGEDTIRDKYEYKQKHGEEF